MHEQIQAPRGSIWAANAIIFITDKVGALVDAMVAARQRQADNYIRNLTTIADVRAYASSFDRSDPGFANDLRAACDRAEREQ